MVMWQTILTKFFEVVSLDCAVEIQELLVCAPLPPAQQHFIGSVWRKSHEP